MQSQLSESEQAFSEEVERFIVRHWLNAAEPRLRLRAWLNEVDTEPLRKQWYRSVVEAGWSVPHWPSEFGGCDWSPKQLHIWLSACLKHQTPTVLTFATGHVGPLLIEYGTADQQALLPKIAALEDNWCLGWAEQSAPIDDYFIGARITQKGPHTSVSGTKARVIDGMRAHWMMCIAVPEESRVDDNKPSIVLIPMDQNGIERTPKAALSTGQPMADIVMTDALVPAWGTLNMSVGELRERLSGLAESDSSGLVDGAALTAQVQRLKEQLRGEPNMEQGVLHDCDALAIEVMGLLGMEQRAIAAAKGIEEELPRALVRLRAQALWAKLSELQIVAFGYYALPFVDSALSDNEGPVDNARPPGEMDMTMVMRRMLSPTIATELGLDLRDSMAQQALGLPVQDH